MVLRIYKFSTIYALSTLILNMWNDISQIGIAFFGIIAIVLVAKKNKWGFVSGLISQPFWLISSYLNKQWGIFFLSIVYTFTWSFGIYEWFYKDKQKRKGKK